MAFNLRKGAKGATGPPMMHLSRELYSLFDNPTVKFWKLPRKKRVRTPMTGVSDFLKLVDEPPVEGEVVNPRTASPVIKSRHAMRQDYKRKRETERAFALQKRLLAWDPHAPDQKKTEDGYKTLFVGRLAEATSDASLAEHFRKYGDVAEARVVLNQAGQSCRYGFVQFTTDDALQKAFRGADTTVLDGSKIVVDVERGRTVSTWAPQRFGGGLGGPPRIKGYTVHVGRGPPDPPPKRQRVWRPKFQPPRG